MHGMPMFGAGGGKENAPGSGAFAYGSALGLGRGSLCGGTRDRHLCAEPILLRSDVFSFATMNCVMAVTVEMQGAGDSGLQADVRAIIEHVLADRPGDWRGSIVGSQANDRWEMKIVGPNAFERSYTLEGSAGEHRPETIRVILGRMLPGGRID